MKDIINRLKRLEGQLLKVRHNLEDNQSCDLVVPQMLAVKGALDAAIEAYLIASLDHCMASKSPEEAKALLKVIIKKL